MKKKNAYVIKSEKNLDILYGNMEELFQDLKYPRRVEDVAYILCCEGSATLRLNLLKRQINKHDLLTLPPGVIMQLVEHTSDFRVYVFLYSYKLVTNMSLVRASMPYLKTVTDNPLISLTEDEALWMKDFFCIVGKKCHRLEEEEHVEFLRNMIMGLMYEVTALYKKKQAAITEKNSRSIQLFKDLTILVMKYYRTERHVNFYAQKLCISPKHLTSTVKALTGRNVSSIIAAAVILDAKTQLHSSNNTVKQIAYSLNFPNASFFGKYFRRHTGMTPLDYRNS